MRLCLAVFLFTITPHAHAAKVILMLNMNYSSEELRALDEEAATRGQRVEMIPPRTLVPLAEPLFLKRDAIQAELIKKFPSTDPLTIKSSVSGMIREGPGWKRDSELAGYLGPNRRLASSKTGVPSRRT